MYTQVPSTPSKSYHDILFIVAVALSLVVAFINFGFAIGVYITRRSYHVLLAFSCKPDKRKKFWQLHLLINTLVVFSIFGFLINITSLLIEAVPNASAVAFLSRLELALMFVAGSFIITIQACLVQLWYNVVQVWHDLDTEEHIKKRKERALTIFLMGLAGISALVGVSTAVYQLVPPRNAADAALATNVVIVSTAILFVDSMVVLVTALILGIFVIRMVNKGLDDQKKTTIIKIVYALVSLYLGYFLRLLGAGGMIALGRIGGIQWKWTFTLPHRSIPDILIIANISLVVWPTSLKSCCLFLKGRAQRFIEPLQLVPEKKEKTQPKPKQQVASPQAAAVAAVAPAQANKPEGETHQDSPVRTEVAPLQPPSEETTPSSATVTTPRGRKSVATTPCSSEELADREKRKSLALVAALESCSLADQSV